MPQETFSLASLDEDVDEDRVAHTQYAPFENMLSATHLVASLLADQQQRNTEQSTSRSVQSSAVDPALCYGVQGGFSMQLRGGRQSTRDVDIVTDTRMKGVWEAVTGEERYVSIACSQLHRPQRGPLSTDTGCFQHRTSGFTIG